MIKQWFQKLIAFWKPFSMHIGSILEFILGSTKLEKSIRKLIERMDAIWDAILGLNWEGWPQGQGPWHGSFFLAIFSRVNLEHAVHLKGAADDGKRL